MARSSLIPGFRFHPTDVELVMYYLKRKLLGKRIIINAVAEVNIYDFSPWDLPDKSSLRSGDLEWFFFCPKARKYSSGSRANRATETGFWKATGKERAVKYKERTVAMIKTLVFHLGNAPNGKRTDWVMHEYSMKDDHLANAGIIQDRYVLCKVFQKSGAGPKNGAQYGAPFNEEEWDDDVASCSNACAVLGSHGTTNTLDYRQKGPATMNTTVPQSTHSISLTEPGSSTVTFSANKTTKILNYKQKGPATTNMTVPQSTCCLSLTEPGSSMVTCSANERHVDVPGNDDVLLFEEIALIMGESTKDLNGNNRNKGVDVANERVKSMAPNEDLGIYDDLVNLINLDDLYGAASNVFKTDGVEYTLDTIITADDLDVDLGDFYVD